MTKDQRLQGAINKLADLFEYDHLIAQTDPAQFINIVVEEIESLREKERVRLLHISQKILGK